MNNKVYIVDAVRTPVAKAYRGGFSQTRPDTLLVHALKSLIERNDGVDPSLISDVIIGCAMPEAEQGMNVARNALLMAGLPDTVPGMTINRFCSSGVQSMAMASDRIALGEADLMIAGGVESMSLVPMGGHKLSPHPEIFKDEHIAIAYGMGLTAEIVAKQYEISAESQCEFAYQSHHKALTAIKEGEFDAEITPVSVTHRQPNLQNGEVTYVEKTVAHDEGPREGVTVEKMLSLKSPFQLKGSVTAATSSQMSDGAGAVLMASEKAVKQFNLTPIASFDAFAVSGVPPEIMGIGPITAIPKALEIAGLGLADIEWIELNEAFAAQSLAVMNTLKLDPTKVNPLGGAIALGHPLGATGAVRAATLVHGMKRKNLKHGLVTMCIGTGMGACAVLTSL